MSADAERFSDHRRRLAGDDAIEDAGDVVANEFDEFLQTFMHDELEFQPAE